MANKKSDHRHNYEDVMVHLTDINPKSHFAHVRIGRCTVCGKMKHSSIFDTIPAGNGFRRLMTTTEFIEANKHLPQFTMSSQEFGGLK